MPWWRRCGPAPIVYADETGWKQGGRRVWLWVFTNLRETVYEILRGPWFRAGRLGAGEKLRGHPRVDGWAPYRYFKEATATDLLQPSAGPLPRATGDGHARGGALLHAWSRPSSEHALALRDRRDAGEISPTWPARCYKGLLQAKMATACFTDRFTNPSRSSDSRNICDAIGTTGLCDSSTAMRTSRRPTIPPNKTFASPMVNRKTCGGGNRFRERGTGPSRSS